MNISTMCAIKRKKKTSEAMSPNKPLNGSNKLTNPKAQSINVIICGSLIMTFCKQLKKLFQS